MDALAPTLSLRLLLDRAMALYRRHFFSMYLPIALPIAITSGILPVSQILWFRLASTMGRNRAPDPATFIASMVPAMAAMFGGLLLVSVVSALANGAALVACVGAADGRTVSMREAWRDAVRPRFVGTLVLSGLAVAAGSVCCLLPGIYLALVFAVAVPAMAAEGVFGSEALARSYRLMTYNPRRELGSDPRVRAFLILFVGVLLAWLLGALVSLPFVVVQQVVMLRHVSAGAGGGPNLTPLLWLQVPAQVLGSMSRVAVSLYVSFAIVLLFLDVRRRREGGDLEAALDALSGGGRQEARS